MWHKGPIAGIAAHDGWIATVGYDNRLILWDSATRQPIARATHDHLVNACDFSHDGRWLVSSSSDYSARIWSVPELRLQAVLPCHGDDVDMARFSPDDRLIATCALDRALRIFTRDGACLHTLTGHTGNVLSLAWIDERRVVSTSVDGTLREWDAVSGTALRVIPIGMRSDCVCIDPGGRIIAGDDRGRIAVLGEGVEPSFHPAHAAGIKQLVLSGDGRRLVTLGYDRAIAVWQLPKSGAPVLLARNDLPPTIWARAAAVCPDGRIAVGTFGTTYALFDPHTGAWDLTGVAAGSAVNAMLETGGTVFTIGDAGKLRADGALVGDVGSLCNFLAVGRGGRLFTGGHLGALCDANSGEILHRHHSPLNCAASFSREGRDHLAIGTYTGEILVFQLDDCGQPRLLITLRPYENAIKSITVGNGLLFSISANTNIAWHALADWSLQRCFAKAHERIANAACALDNGGFASTGRDRMLRLWLPEGDIAIATPHPNSVKSMAASSDGSLILTGSYGGTIALFDRATMRFAPMRRISKSGISAIIWSDRMQGFLAASYDGQVHPVPSEGVARQRRAA